MTIVNDYITLVEAISEKIEIPLIKQLVVPLEENASETDKKANFAAVVLEDNSVGIIFISLDPEVKETIQQVDPGTYQNQDPTVLAQDYRSRDLTEKTIGLGCINAISQFVYRKANFNFDITTDSLGLLNIEMGDVVGMVGFFPPLVKMIERKGTRLIVVEKKVHKIKSGKNWTVTLDPSQLEACNKVLITATTVLNDSIDDILQHCSNAEMRSLIGPTAGFLPDPLFKRGVDVVGGSFVVNPDLLVSRIRNNIRWGDSAEKFTIEKADYPGFEIILDLIQK
ncbi:MAG: hypothetical protein EU544_04255 [Promethearchaeota archaeon]|nr:MAG: hypothetical protein EU544_04255 [Candidatus Lokiarchaeota archaeon]